MESALKDLIVLAVLALGTPVSIVAASVSSRIRDAVFVLLIFGTTLTIGWLDVNFVSREWYRGTTRGFEVSFLDVLAVTLLCSTLWNRARNNARLFWPPSFGWLLVYFLYCCFNVAISDPRLFGLFELTKILRGIVAFLAVAYFVRGEREIKLLAFGVCAAVSFEGFVSLFDRYVLWRHRIAGTLIHPNALSTYCCVTVPLLIAMSLSNMGKYARLLLAFGAVLGAGCVILTISRTGFAVILAVSGGTLLVTTGLRLTARNLAILGIALVIASGMLYKSWDTIEKRYTLSPVEDELQEDQGRGTYFLLAKNIALDRFFGVGLNNWSYWVSLRYGPDIGRQYTPYNGTDQAPDRTLLAGRGLADRAQAAPAHSLMPLTIGELGWPGLFLFAGLWVQWWRMAGTFLIQRTPAVASRYGVGAFMALWGAFLSNVTEWAFRSTPIFFLVHILMGGLAAAYYQRRHASWRRP